MKNRLKKPEKSSRLNPASPEPLQLTDLVQFNSRVPMGMKMAVKNAVGLAGVDMETAMQDAWKLYLGVQDEMIEPRRTAILKAFKTLNGDRRPFEVLLTPSNSNALTGETQSAKLTIRMGS